MKGNASDQKAWRVKLYHLEAEGMWRDKGTGTATSIYSKKLAGPSIIVRSEVDSSLLLETKIQYEDVYERQNENIIMWRETDEMGDLDLALSFQDTSGCQSMWTAIGNVQEQYRHHDHSPICDESNVEDFMSEEFKANENFSLVAENPSQQGKLHLPLCTAGNMIEIRDRLSQTTMPKSHAEFYANVIMETNGLFLHKLIEIFSDLEDLDDTASLGRIAEIWRSILLLNDPMVTDFVLADNVFLQMVGALEFDPQLGEKPEYRAFFSCKVRLKQVVRPLSSELQQTATKLHRMKFLKDDVIRPTIDESGVSTLNAMISFAINDLCTQLFSDHVYIAEVLTCVFQSTKSGPGSRQRVGPHWRCGVIVDGLHGQGPNTSASTTDVSADPEFVAAGATVSKAREDCVRFLRELFVMSKSLQMEKRLDLFSRLMNKLRQEFFAAIVSVLRDDESQSQERIHVAEILSTLVVALPSSLRQAVIEGPVPNLPTIAIKALAIGQTDDHAADGSSQCSHDSSNTDARDHNDQCPLFVVIRRIIEDCEVAVIDHLAETLKVLIDVDRMDRNDKDKFLELFYDFYVAWLMYPFLDQHNADEFIKLFPTACNGGEDHTRSHQSGGATGNQPQEPSAVAQSRRVIFEVICACASSHAYRMKYFVMRNNSIARCLRILSSTHRHMHFGALRFVRSVIATKEDFYIRHIVKTDGLRPVFNLLKSTSKRDNLVTSTIIEMVELIRTEGIRPLIDYIVENHSDAFSNLCHIEFFEALRLRHEQALDRDRQSGGAIDNPDGSSDFHDVKRAKNRQQTEREREEAYLEQDDDDANVDDETKNFGDDNVGPDKEIHQGGLENRIDNGDGWHRLFGNDGETENFIRMMVPLGEVGGNSSSSFQSVPTSSAVSSCAADVRPLVDRNPLAMLAAWYGEDDDAESDDSSASSASATSGFGNSTASASSTTTETDSWIPSSSPAAPGRAVPQTPIFATTAYGPVGDVVTHAIDDTGESFGASEDQMCGLGESTQHKRSISLSQDCPKAGFPTSDRFKSGGRDSVINSGNSALGWNSNAGLGLEPKQESSCADPPTLRKRFSSPSEEPLPPLKSKFESDDVAPPIVFQKRGTSVSIKGQGVGFGGRTSHCSATTATTKTQATGISFTMKKKSRIGP